MSYDVSIILISHNRHKQTRLTLYSLICQNFDLSRLEVILVDDASTDNTYKLKRFKGPFHYRYIRTQENVGRSKAKNIGVNAAQGSIVIFLDGEVMVDPDFVSLHMQHHAREPNIVVSGTQGHHCSYTVLDPSFSVEQIHHFYSFVKNNPDLLKKWSFSLTNHEENISYILKLLQNRTTSIELFDLEDVQKQLYQLLCFPSRIINRFGRELKGSHLAWMFCITRNASVSKMLLKQVGPFNEQFQGWGYEDWEMGYRLYKLGAAFVEEPRMLTYHQEHAYSKVERKKEDLQNYLRFTKFHPDIEVCAIVLNKIKRKTLLEVNDIINDFKALSKDNPHEYRCFKQTFLNCLEKIMERLAEGSPVTHLLHSIGIEDQQEIKEKTFKEYLQIKQAGTTPHIAETFEMLISL